MTVTDVEQVTIQTWADDDRLSVTAWDEHGDLVGLAWCDTRGGEHPHHAEVEVTPAHRRQGIGARLLRTLVDEAAAHGIRTLTWTQPADDLVVRSLVRSAGVVCARRVEDGRARSAIFALPVG